MFSCAAWDNGHMVNGRYTPKKPNYKLKDKLNNIIPSNLDTVSVYRLIASYSNGNLNTMIGGISFLKFYPKGRVLDIQVLESDSLVLNETYKEKLLTGRIYTHFGYYYSKDGEQIYTEFFRPNYDLPNAGSYIINSYFLNTSGDTLTHWEPKYKYKRIYVKEKLPKVLEGYPVNW